MQAAPSPHSQSPTERRQLARLAGACYLLIIVFGVTGQLLLRGPLIDYTDATATAANLLAEQSAWRLSIAGDLLMHSLDIVVMIALFHLLSPVNRTLACMALFANVIQTAIAGANKLTLIMPLLLLDSGSPAEVKAVAIEVMQWIHLHDYGFGIALIFFGLACLAYGWLLFHSAEFPKFIGVLMALAGCAYLLNSVTLLLAPALSGLVFPVLVLSFIGELTFTLWLLIKGTRT